MKQKELLFRAWDKQNNKMIQPKGGDFIAWHSMNNWKDCLHVMQYSELSDKEGRELFEGDIVRFVGGTANFLRCGIYAEDVYKIGVELVVVKLRSGFTLQMKHHIESDISNLVGNVSNYDFWNHQSSLVVIGNIYENPELL